MGLFYAMGVASRGLSSAFSSVGSSLPLMLAPGSGAALSFDMRSVATLVTVVACAVPLLAQGAAVKPPKKGDTIIVRGCLRGSAVEQADLMIEDPEGEAKHNDQVPAMTYRLQGDKDVLKTLRDKHDRMVVQVKGILRSEVTRSGIGTDVGRTRITIGADPRNPTRGAEQPLPVLEAKSFEATTVSCK